MDSFTRFFKQSHFESVGRLLEIESVSSLMAHAQVDFPDMKTQDRATKLWNGANLGAKICGIQSKVRAVMSAQPWSCANEYTVKHIVSVYRDLEVSCVGFLDDVKVMKQIPQCREMLDVYTNTFSRKAVQQLMVDDIKMMISTYDLDIDVKEAIGRK